MKIKKYLIRDDEVVILNSKDVEEYDETKIKTLDSIADSDNSCDEVIYNIATVSDKEINSRIYPDQHIKDTVLQNKWTSPFLKPFLINHDIYAEPLGRIVDAVYVNHSDLTTEGGQDAVPEAVLMKFKKEGLLNDGTGSVILKIKPFGDTLAKVKDGVLLTTSQASSTDALTCSICGKDYYECEHRIGAMYDGKKAILRTGALFPYENSVVNRPANDSSLNLIYNVAADKALIFGTDNETVLTRTTADSQETAENLQDATISNNIEDIQELNDNKGVVMDKKITAQLKKIKERKIKDLSKTFTLDDVKKEEFVRMLDSFEEEETFAVLDLVELIETEISAIITDSESLKKEIEELKNKIIILESADHISLESEEQVEAESVVDENAEEEPEAIVEDETQPEPEVQNEDNVVPEEEVNNSTTDSENVNTESVPENVPDFLNVDQEQEKPVLAEKKETKDQAFNLNFLLDPKKMFE